MCIAVEGKDTAQREGLPRHCVIEVLARRIAVDLDGHTTLRSGLKHNVPVRDHAGTRSGDAAAWVCEDSDCRLGLPETLSEVFWFSIRSSSVLMGAFFSPASSVMD